MGIFIAIVTQDSMVKNNEPPYQGLVTHQGLFPEWLMVPVANCMSMILLQNPKGMHLPCSY
jgi:hypothetical protein